MNIFTPTKICLKLTNAKTFDTHAHQVLDLTEQKDILAQNC